MEKYFLDGKEITYKEVLQYMQEEKIYITYKDNGVCECRFLTEGELTENKKIKYNALHSKELKSELEKVKEDIEQVDLFNMVRDDIAAKRARAAQIVNELRILEGKEKREVIIP